MSDNDALLAEAEQHEPNPAKVHICGSCGDPWPCLPARLAARVRELEAEVERLRGFYRSVNEALNSGDGVYRP